jgi:hypothetical protein
MKLQASRPISPKNLQSQTSSPTKNRLALSRLGILHGRLNIHLPLGQNNSHANRSVAERVNGVLHARDRVILDLGKTASVL